MDKPISYTEILLTHDEYSYIYNGQIIPAPENAIQHLVNLTAQLSAKVPPTENEACIECDDKSYRASRLPHRGDNDCWILRLLPTTIPTPQDLGFNAELSNWLSSQPHGLVLFSGPSAAGKTTSCSAFMAERLRLHKGFAVTVEDPPELQLDGSHGEGRCVQLDAERLGGWDAACARVLRYGALSSLMLGEIRTPETASAALSSSLNGTLVCATIHSPGISETISRFLLLACRIMDEEIARTLLSDVVRAIIFQRLVPGPNNTQRMRYDSVIASDEDGPALANAIRTKGVAGGSLMREISARQLSRSKG